MSDPIADLSLKLDRLLANQAEQGRQMTEGAAAMARLHQALRGPEGVIGLLGTLQDGVALILAAAGTAGGHELRDLLERIEALLTQQGGDLSLIRAVLDRPPALPEQAASNGIRLATGDGVAIVGHG